MENSSQSIFDISSDEEVGFGEPRKVGGNGVGGFGDRDDLDWLSELLVEVGGKDDSDDVVLVSETFANPSKKSRFEPLKPSSKTVDDDDDDCIVLDGDPDKPVAASDNCSVGDGGGDDDLEIVGEKGEVACRDFPHARHLCVKFIFASTPHSTHCSQCHCYVCDSLAPCSQWGTGVSSIDHCHATDKDEYWKTERKRLKKAEKPAPAFTPRSSIPNTSHVRASFRPTNQASSLAPQWSNSQFSQSPMLRPVAPHIAFRPNPPRHVPLIRAPRSQFSHMVKRPGVVRASSPINSPLNGPPLPTNTLKRCRTRTIQPSPVSTRTCVMAPRTVRPVQQVNNVGRANYSHPPQPHFQPYVNFVSPAAHLQPQVTPQPSVLRPKTYVPSQNAIGSELNPRFVSPSNQNEGKNNLANQQFSQPQARGNPNSSLFDMRNDIQEVNNHTQIGIDAYSNDFGLAWDYSSLIPGNVQVQEVVQQSQSAGPVDNSQVQSVVEPVVDNNYQGVDNNVSCQFSESIPNETFESLFDSLPVSPLWNAYSPEPASLDTSNLFDFLVFGE